MNKSNFTLPLNIDERARSTIREVHLYVKEGPTGKWLRKDTAPPSQSGFTYHLSQDGEYWFAVVTIDHGGKATPGDLNSEQPGVIVVLDTQGPQVNVKALPTTPEGICVECDVHDANPNPFLTRFEYQTGDKNWREAEPGGPQGSTYCIPRQAVLTGMCRVSCTDRAQNTTTREFSLVSIGLTNEGLPVEHAETAKAAPNAAAAETAKAAPALAPETAKASPAPAAEKTPAPVQQTHSAAPVLVEPGKTMPAEKGAVTSSAPSALHFPDAPDLGSKGASPHSAEKDEHHTAEHPADPKLSATRHLVNNRHLCLEYRIQDEGSSGVGEVDVWITRDGGKTWDMLCSDPQHKSPIEFDLPGEGLFGLRLMTTNGLGFGDGPPKHGDVPDYLVEVDTTKPQAELLTAKLGPVVDTPYVDITWKASDQNFGPEPIDLYYSVSPQGPWTPIVTGWQNSGRFKWYLPRGIGREAYLQMVATDRAGNSVHCDLTGAVLLDDNSRPSARIVTITTPSSGVSPASGVLPSRN